VFEPDEDEVSRMAEDEVIQVGKNTKVSVLSQRLMQRFLEQGWIELETVGTQGVNQAVKAVAKARQALEAEGYAPVVIPKLVEVPPGQGSQTVVHLTAVNMGSL